MTNEITNEELQKLKVSALHGKEVGDNVGWSADIILALIAKVESLAAPSVANGATAGELPPLPEPDWKPSVGDDECYFTPDQMRAYATAAIAAQQAAPNADLAEIARLIGTIFYAGDFVAETHNERELEALIIKTGYRYTNWGEVEAAALASLPPKEK